MQLTELFMTAEAWTIVGTGIAILVAITASNRSIRSEIRDLRTQVYKLEARINGNRSVQAGMWQCFQHP